MYAYNSSLGSSRKTRLLAVLALVLAFAGAGSARAQEQKPNLYVVAAGINAYESAPLKAAVKDATDVTNLFLDQQGKLFHRVNVTRLLDSNATTTQILNAIENVRLNTDANSYVIVYLAGHGGGSDQSEYGYCAYNEDLSWSRIQNALKDMPGTVIVVLDTCGSGAAGGGSNLLVMAACESGKMSTEEDGPNGNGYFTKAFVEGLSGQADADGDGIVTLSELQTYVANRLNQISGGQQADVILQPQSGDLPATLPLTALKSLGAVMP